MRPWNLAAALLVLAGCQKKEEAPAAPALDGRGRSVGRFMALGHFAPGRLWREIDRGAPPADPRAALPEDDDQILTVVDTRTGEIRQCGNLSGACIAFNPWMKPAAQLPSAPAALQRHLEQAMAEDQAESEASLAVDKRNAPRPTGRAPRPQAKP